MTKNIDEHLDEIIKINLEVNDLSKDWYYWFIRFDNVMNKCNPFGTYRKRWGDEILLVPARVASNKSNAEYYTFVLYQLLQKMGLKVHYQFDYPSRFIGITKINDIECWIWAKKDALHFESGEIKEVYSVENMTNVAGEISTLIKKELC